METKSNRTIGFLSLFDMQTKFFERALEGMSDAGMYKRLDTQANHMAWISGAIVQQRFLMTSETSPGQVQTGGDLFKDNKGLQQDATYPTIEEYLADWKRITPLAREAMVMIDDAKLDSDFDMGFMVITYFELLSFTIYREASMIGQLALWRRLLGYGALRYD